MTVSLCRKYDLSQSLFYADHPLGFQYFPPRPITEGNRSILGKENEPCTGLPCFYPSADKYHTRGVGALSYAGIGILLKKLP